jgi:hypothetical protein
MKLLTPENSLHFFKNNLPQFLSGKYSNIQRPISHLEQAFKQRKSDNFHAVLLEKGEALLIHIVQKSIESLSDKYGSDRDRASQLIREYIRNFSRFEELLFGLYPKYRDHTLHSLWVYLFGHQWIMSIGGYDKIILAGQNHIIFTKSNMPQFVLHTESLNADTPHLEAMWAIIASLHDVGYPVQTITSEANEIFSNILNPFAIDFSSLLQIDIGSRISILNPDIYDLCSTMLRPEKINREEEQEYFKMASNLEKEGNQLPLIVPRNREIAKDEGLGTEFKIAWVNKDHAAWSATFIFKNIPFLHESDHRGGGGVDFIKLLTRRDIIYSIVHHTSPGPKDVALNRFQFILLFIDDMEERLRFGKGGKKRGLVADSCKIKWHPTFKYTKLELDYSGSEASGRDKYEELSQRFKAQSTQKRNYPITIKVIDKNFAEPLTLLLSKDL